MVLNGSQPTSASIGIRIYDKQGRWLGTVSLFHVSARSHLNGVPFRPSLPDARGRTSLGGSVLEALQHELSRIRGLQDVGETYGPVTCQQALQCFPSFRTPYGGDRAPLKSCAARWRNPGFLSGTAGRVNALLPSDSERMPPSARIRLRLLIKGEIMQAEVRTIESVQLRTGRTAR